MDRNILSAALVSVIALPLLIGSARATDVTSVGANPTSDQLIKALSPQPGAPPLKFRGIRLLTAKAAAEPDARAPAVALDIKFGVNSAELTPEAKEVIKQLGTAMASDQLSNFHFQLEGHTDSTGRHDRNVVLSKERAEAVRSYLVANYGIKPERLETVGVGPDAPLDPANPTSGVNRRVQIVNLGQ
jgi:outer membrane protein OmpA-like peptidoglycan-associated protein